MTTSRLAAAVTVLMISLCAGCGPLEIPGQGVEPTPDTLERLEVAQQTVDEQMAAFNTKADAVSREIISARASMSEEVLKVRLDTYLHYVEAIGTLERWSADIDLARARVQAAEALGDVQGIEEANRDILALLRQILDINEEPAANRDREVDYAALIDEIEQRAQLVQRGTPSTAVGSAPQASETRAARVSWRPVVVNSATLESLNITLGVSAAITYAFAMDRLGKRAYYRLRAQVFVFLLGCVFIYYAVRVFVDGWPTFAQFVILIIGVYGVGRGSYCWQEGC